MMTVLQNECGKLTMPVLNPRITRILFHLYRDFNLQSFPREVLCYSSLGTFADLVYKKYSQEPPKLIEATQEFLEDLKEINDEFLSMRKHRGNKRVLLGFSGGLDSVFQMCDLLQRGYDVVLFTLKNVNTYENGQGVKAGREIVDTVNAGGVFHVEYVEASIAKDWKRDNKWRQSWPENPIKNQLILAIMIDYCLEHQIDMISLGDDLELDIEDSVCGINTTDSKQLTEEFLNGIRGISPDMPRIDFMPIQKDNDKLYRIMSLEKFGLLDKYYSCVQTGRFNKRFHDMAEKKYGVTLPAHNCGCYCRKCAMHCLLMYYWKESGKWMMTDKRIQRIQDKYVSTFTDEFIEKCWQVMWKNAHSADYKFFSPELPLEQRVYNLYHY